MSEHEIQKAIVQYLALKNLCYFAVPNGGHRHIVVASKLKAEGVRSGVPDIALIHQGHYYGIEVKTLKGRLSDSQKTMIQLIHDKGGLVGVVRSVKDTINLLKEWKIA
jgi:hypothetical protein